MLPPLSLVDKMGQFNILSIKAAFLQHKPLLRCVFDIL